LFCQFVTVLVIVAAQLAHAGVTYSYDSSGHLIEANYGAAGVVVCA
jgi:hypothetical protein